MSGQPVVQATVRATEAHALSFIVKLLTVTDLGQRKKTGYITNTNQVVPV